MNIINKIYIIAMLVLFVALLIEKSSLDECKRLNMRLQNDNYTLKLDLDSQNDAIEKIVLAQQEKQNEIMKAEEDVALLKKQYDTAAEDVLAQNVPSNCEKSVQWGIQQGHTIYECWIAVC